MADNFNPPQDGKPWDEAVIQTRFKSSIRGIWTPWTDIPAGAGTLNFMRTKIRALRAAHPNDQYRLVIRSCVVVDYDMASIAKHPPIVGQENGG